MSRYYRSFLEESGAVYTARTTAFATATAITDTTILNALNTFDISIDSIASKIKACYPYVGADATKHSYNFINPSLFQITWSGGITHSSNGFQGNGTNGYGNTNINPSSVLSLNNTCIGTYVRTNIAENSIDIGAYNAVRQLVLYPKYSDGNMYMAIFSDNSSKPMDNSLGLFTASRLSSTFQKFYKNGVSGLTASQTSTALVPVNIGVGACITNTTPILYSTRQHSFDFVSEGLDDSEQLLFYNAIQTLQTTLSRNV